MPPNIHVFFSRKQPFSDFVVESHHRTWRSPKKERVRLGLTLPVPPPWVWKRHHGNPDGCRFECARLHGFKPWVRCLFLPEIYNGRHFGELSISHCYSNKRNTRCLCVRIPYITLSASDSRCVREICYQCVSCEQATRIIVCISLVLTLLHFAFDVTVKWHQKGLCSVLSCFDTRDLGLLYKMTKQNTRLLHLLLHVF